MDCKVFDVVITKNFKNPENMMNIGFFRKFDISIFFCIKPKNPVVQYAQIVRSCFGWFSSRFYLVFFITDAPCFT